MVYRNIKTGAEIITESVIKAPNWELVTGKVAPKEAPKEPPKKETSIEEPVTKSAPKKSAEKKRGTRK